MPRSSAGWKSPSGAGKVAAKYTAVNRTGATLENTTESKSHETHSRRNGLLQSLGNRASRRASLLAKRGGGELVLVHVVDDDQPVRIVAAERSVATELLDEQVRTLRDVDGIPCSQRIVLGSPFAGIITAAGDLRPEWIVLGPHRRQALKDIFIGTTAERVVRQSRWPVLMADGVPSAPYRHVAIAVDLSDCSRDAARAIDELCFSEQATVIHVVETPGTRAMPRASLTDAESAASVADKKARASRDLDAFLDRLPLAPSRRLLEVGGPRPADTICAAAERITADLIVVGTHGRSGPARPLLGGVAEQVLKHSDRDVLAVPPRFSGD
jgi:nucleotide-binding universal stress UspA family protein